MAEAGRSPAEPPGEAAGQVAAKASESEASAPPRALRRLPGDPSPRGRSQSDLSSCSSRGRPLRVHISGSGKGWGAGGRPGRGAGAGRWRRWPGCSPGVLGRWSPRLAAGAEGLGGRSWAPPAALLPGGPRLGPRVRRCWSRAAGCGRRAGWARAPGARVLPPGEGALPPRLWFAGWAIRKRNLLLVLSATLSLGRVRSCHLRGWASAGLGNPPNCSAPEIERSRGCGSGRGVLLARGLPVKAGAGGAEGSAGLRVHLVLRRALARPRTWAPPWAPLCSAGAGAALRPGQAGPGARPGARCCVTWGLSPHPVSHISVFKVGMESVELSTKWGGYEDWILNPF